MFQIRTSKVADLPILVDIWRRAVRATHHFLSEEDFREIETFVSEKYIPHTEVLVATNRQGKPVGFMFMGLSRAHIDTLFIDPDQRGNGIGKMLIAHAERISGPLTVDVNEQNQQAVGFYLRMGFTETRRSAVDDGGRPYPLLHLKTPIPIPVWKPIDHEFSDLIDDVITSLPMRLPGLIHGIYLYGSVARGNATKARSDLDLSIILSREPNESEKAALENERKRLESDHSEVSKIDFDLGVLSEVLSLNSTDSWGYWLKHCCRCIWGVDLSSEFPVFFPSRKIAEAVNAGYRDVVENYVNRIDRTESPEQIRRLKREASRKIVRATQVLRSNDDTNWPANLEDYYQAFSEEYPERALELRYFLDQAISPDEEISSFASRATCFVAWLAAEHAASQNS